jgi:Holliday junction resolvasome RuvABC endonuclease subunit
MRIFAIDGSLNCSGWAVLDARNGKGTEHIKGSNYGTIKTKPTMSLGFKLSYIRIEFIKLINSYHPDVIVMEDTYAGKNALTNARLNNAKGVIFLTAYELLGTDPVCITAAKARACVGFKNNKEEPYAFFKKQYKLKETFEKGNDITDAFTLGWYYVISSREECHDPKKKAKAKRKKK